MPTAKWQACSSARHHRSKDERVPEEADGDAR
jgi:hypothetical protein